MAEKQFIHPTVRDNEEKVSSPAVEPPVAGKFPCPCCGNRTFPERAEKAIAFICPVCFWENDVFLTNDREPSEENHGLTLCQTRENYGTFGAVERRFLPYVRPPLEEEKQT